MFCDIQSCSTRLYDKIIDQNYDILLNTGPLKGVRYDLKMDLRGIKISELTIFGPLSSEMKFLNRYNLWFMIYKLCSNDGFFRRNDGFSA